MKIKGKLVGETEKALRIEIREDENGKLVGKTSWYPKTRVRLETEYIEIEVPKWIYDQKVEEDPKEHDGKDISRKGDE